MTGLVEVEVADFHGDVFLGDHFDALFESDFVGGFDFEEGHFEVSESELVGQGVDGVCLVGDLDADRHGDVEGDLFFLVLHFGFEHLQALQFVGQLLDLPGDFVHKRVVIFSQRV